MAKVKLGPVIGQASGSIGGTVFAHNRGGNYIRARSAVCRHTTIKSFDAKVSLAFFSQYWSLLSDSQRSSWTEWARQHPVTDSLGEARPLDGHQAYVSLSARAARIGTTPPATPPTIMAPEPLSSLSLAAVHASAVTLTILPNPTPASQTLWISACLVNSHGAPYVKNNLSFMGFYTGATTGSKVITVLFNALCGPHKVGQIATVFVSMMDTATGLLSQPMSTHALVS